MSSILNAINGLLSSSLLRTPLVGALLGFGWIIGEYFATKTIDRVESYGEEKKGQIEELNANLLLENNKG